ncbi:hypothetical protein G9A89_023663 [Geosiphon pyriformis]|nr:hypothetical protein G9A89_023663 [Geosiphon pyriformis]
MSRQQEYSEHPQKQVPSESRLQQQEYQQQEEECSDNQQQEEEYSHYPQQQEHPYYPQQQEHSYYPQQQEHSYYPQQENSYYLQQPENSYYTSQHAQYPPNNQYSQQPYTQPLQREYNASSQTQPLPPHYESGRNTPINDPYLPHSNSNSEGYGYYQTPPPEQSPEYSRQPDRNGSDKGGDDDFADKLGKESIPEDDGWEYRPPHHGHIITRGEMISRIVPYYEMFAINVFFLGYKVLDNAQRAVGGSTYRIVLYEACTDRWKIEDFDFCAASRLVKGLIGGAIIYFIVTALFAIAIAMELKRKGYHATFTALWNSPFFLVCFFFPDVKRVDIMSIPNKYVKLTLWTRAHIQRISMAVYCFVCATLVLNSLTNKTAESAKIRGENLNDGIKKYYNPYLIPYYVALYIFFKTLLTMLIEIFQDKHIRNQPELIGRSYESIKLNGKKE